MEFENLREALEFLLDINSPSSAVTNQDNQPASVDDMKELNMEALANVADLVGMSDLYLDD
jgi:hypothetical protein